MLQTYQIASKKIISVHKSCINYDTMHKLILLWNIILRFIRPQLQQLPELALLPSLLILTLEVGFSPESPAWCFLNMSLVSVINASSTFILSFALVSKNRIPFSLAIPSPFSLLTIRLSFRSHLLARIHLSTPSLACSWIFRNHFAILSKVFSCVIS